MSKSGFPSLLAKFSNVHMNYCEVLVLELDRKRSQLSITTQRERTDQARVVALMLGMTS
jgi:hypothetical protein